MRLWDARAPVRLSIFFGVLVAVFGAAWWKYVRMPGRSFSGPAPALRPDEAELAEALRADVMVVARDIGERNWAEMDALDKAASFIEERLRAASYAVARQTFMAASRFSTGRQTLSAPEQTFANIVAEKKGTDEIVVVGAHYDSANLSPGGNDNGSGIAALLAIAERLAREPTKRTLRFIAFANEEPPFFQTEGMGSLVSARASRARGEKIVAMISLETIGYYTQAPNSQKYPIGLLGLAYPSRGEFVALVGGSAARALVREAVGAFRAVATIPSEGAALPMGIPGVGWSDHWSYASVGYPAVMITDTAVMRDPRYHTRGDDADHIDYPSLARAVVGVKAVVRQLANR